MNIIYEGSSYPNISPPIIKDVESSIMSKKINFSQESSTRFLVLNSSLDGSKEYVPDDLFSVQNFVNCTFF